VRDYTIRSNPVDTCNIGSHAEVVGNLNASMLPPRTFTQRLAARALDDIFNNGNGYWKWHLHIVVEFVSSVTPLQEFPAFAKFGASTRRKVMGI
jgi:hypothetical protein